MEGLSVDEGERGLGTETGRDYVLKKGGGGVGGGGKTTC